MLTTEVMWSAVALLLIVEGLLPVLSPSIWRRMVAQIAGLKDGQIRFFGLLAVFFGFAILWL